MKIAKFEKGSKDRTAMHSAVMNEIVDPLNGLVNLKFIPAGIAKLEVVGESATLTFNLPALAAAAFDHPFKLQDVGGGEIRIRYGTVNGREPTGMYVGDDPPYKFTAASSGYAWLKVKLEIVGPDYIVTDRQIGQGSTVPTDGGHYYYRQIGSWKTLEGGAFSFGQGITLSMQCKLCGGVEIEWGPA